MASSHLPNRFISTNVSNLDTERFIIGSNAAIPKLLGFHAVTNNVSELVNLDLAIRVPIALGRGTVYANKLNKLQSVIADNDRLVRLLFGRIERGFLVELGDFGHYTVTDKFINGDCISTEQGVGVFFATEFNVISDDNIIKNCFQIAEFDFNSRAIVLSDEFAKFRFIGNVNVIHDNLFDVMIQVG